MTIAKLGVNAQFRKGVGATAAEDVIAEARGEMEPGSQETQKEDSPRL